jgi:hypothetical protein
MHVVEHLPVDALFALFRGDPTHIAPRHAAALTVLAREHGFAIEEIRAVHEVAEGAKIPIHPGDAPELQRVIHAVNDRLFAPQDLRLVLRKA